MSKAKPIRASRSVAKRSAVPAEPGWNTEGMTDAEKKEAEAIRARVISRPERPSVSLKREKGASAIVVGNGTDASKTLHSMRAYELSGSGSPEFANDLLRRVAETIKVTNNDEADSTRLTAALAMIGGIAPQNELEATMALQMVAAHEATLSCFTAALLNRGAYEVSAVYSGMANKAMRSFALHAEALSKMRRNGEQVVRHVHVNEGGQAVIAQTVNTGGGGER